MKVKTLNGNTKWFDRQITVNKNQKDYNISAVNLTFALHAPKGAPLTKPLTNF